MALKTFVKIGNISSLSDARYCAGMMVDVLGFNLNKNSPDYVTPQSFDEITNWISGVKLVGEFGNSDLASIKQEIDSYNINIVEITDSSLLTELQPLSTPLALRIDIKEKNDLTTLPSIIDRNASGCEWIAIFCNERSLIAELDEIVDLINCDKLLKGYDLNTETVLDLPELWKGIALEGSPEEQPGFKDYGLVMDILEELEED